MARKAAVITASDKGYAGQREDKSGPLAAQMLKNAGYEVICVSVVPDEKDMLIKEMIRLSDEEHANLIMTTGGTGFSKRDVTPEATREVIEREACGITQAILYYSLQITPRAMLSRAIAGIRGDSLIINMPGSPKAVKEAMEFILGSIEHGLDILLGEASECARK